MSDLFNQLKNDLANGVVEVVMAGVAIELNAFRKREMPFCYSETEAAEKLQVSKSTMERIRKNGGIDFSRSPSGKPVYMAHHIYGYLQRNEQRNGKQEVTLKDVLGNSTQETLKKTTDSDK